MRRLRRLASGRDRDPYGRQLAPIYLELRSQILTLDPTSVGIAPADGLPQVWAVILELGYPNGIATLVAMRDGTASLYTSSGGGVFGGAGRPPVAEQAVRLVDFIATDLAADASVLPPADSFPPPDPGHMRIHARTFDGGLSSDAATPELESGTHPSPLRTPQVTTSSPSFGWPRSDPAEATASSFAGPRASSPPFSCPNAAPVNHWTGSRCH
jgi:hypothetical protein